MGTDSELREQLQKTSNELVKYKGMVFEYEKEMKKVLSEYENIKSETMEIKKIINLTNKDMEEIVAEYNYIKSEYLKLEKEFFNIINLAEASPEVCINTLKEYAVKINQVKNVEEENQNQGERFRVIKGGKA